MDSRVSQQSDISAEWITEKLHATGWYDHQDNRTLEDLQRFYIPRQATVTDRLVFHISKTLNVLSISINNTRRWDKIVDNLYLGVIPDIADVDTILSLAAINQKVHIFSIVENFELKRQATPSMWYERGAKCTRLPMSDFTADIEVANIISIVKLIHEAISSGELVYVHCKAGKARSAMVVATYLALYGALFENLNISSLAPPAERLRIALDHLKSCRPQVDLHHDELTDQDWVTLSKQGTLANPRIGKLLKALQALNLMIYGDVNIADLQPVNGPDQEIDSYDYLSLSLSNFLDESLSDDQFAYYDHEINEPNDIFCSLRFKKDFITFSSFNRLRSFETLNEGSIRGNAIALLLQNIYQSTDYGWYIKLTECFKFLQQKGLKGLEILDLPYSEKVQLRTQFGPIGILITSSKMNDDLYGLMSDLVNELEKYKNRYLPDVNVTAQSTLAVRSFAATENSFFYHTANLAKEVNLPQAESHCEADHPCDAKVTI